MKFCREQGKQPGKVIGRLFPHLQRPPFLMRWVHCISPSGVKVGALPPLAPELCPNSTWLWGVDQL